MCRKEITAVILLCFAHTFGVTIESRFKYPARFEDVEYVVPGSSKSLQRAVLLNKKFKASPADEQEPLRSLTRKYIMLLNADSSQANYDGAEDEDLEIISQQAGKTEESFHALIPNPVIDKKQVSYIVQQPKKNYASVGGLHTVPHGVSRARQEQLKHVIQEVPSSDTNEGAPIIAYQLHEYAEPKTYKFRKERQFRGEKRHSHAGRVKEPFGFSNGKGRTTIVKYTTNPEGGFRIEEVQ